MSNPCARAIPVAECAELYSSCPCGARRPTVMTPPSYVNDEPWEPDMANPVNWERQEAPPYNTAVMRLCMRVADTDESYRWPALVERCEVRKCMGCRVDVYYDPKASVTNPELENIVCNVCTNIVFEAMANESSWNPNGPKPS